jgi:hypothetical protein
VAYICLLETRNSSATHLEVLDAESRNDAVKEATRLLARHPSATTVEIFSGADTIATIYAPAPA